MKIEITQKFTPIKIFLIVVLLLFLGFVCVYGYLALSNRIGEKKHPIVGRGVPLSFYLNKRANRLTELAVRQIFQRWEEVTHFNFVYGGRSIAGLRRDGKNTISFLVKWPSWVPINKIGYCKRWYDFDGNIVEADIIFNMQRVLFTTLVTNTPGAYYMEGVLTHEIGHMIGLGHINCENSIMKPKSSLSESFFKGVIDPITINAYKKLYNLRNFY